MNIVEIIAAVNFYNAMFEAFRLVTMTLPVLMLGGMILGICYSFHYKNNQLLCACRAVYIPRKKEVQMQNDNVTFMQLEKEVQIEIMIKMITQRRELRISKTMSKDPNSFTSNPFYFLIHGNDGLSGSPQVLVGKGSNFLK